MRATMGRNSGFNKRARLLRKGHTVSHGLPNTKEVVLVDGSVLDHRLRREHHAHAARVFHARRHDHHGTAAVVKEYADHFEQQLQRAHVVRVRVRGQA